MRRYRSKSTIELCFSIEFTTEFTSDPHRPLGLETSQMTFKTILSHPPEDEGGTRLSDHLQETAERIVDLGQFEGEKHGVSEQIAYATGRLHDFGKVTPAFQSYLRQSYSGPAHLRYHARISAFAGFWAARKLDASDREALAVFVAIARHHGRLPDLLDYLLDRIIEAETTDSGVHNYATQQVDAIASETSTTADTLLRSATNGAATWNGFQTAMESGQITESLTTLVAEKEAFGYLNRTPEELPPQLYDVILALWGALTLADKTSAAGINRADLSPASLDLDALETYIDDLPAGSGQTETLNSARERARQEAMERARTHLGSGGADVGVLTLPTGLGKTFTGTSVGLTLQEQLKQQRDHRDPPSVVYALPFTAIIEQTRGLFEDPDIFDADSRSREFTVHHYLSDTVTFPSAEAEVSGRGIDSYVPEAGLLGESWRAGLVLTTFVQLFESLAGPTNSQSLKLPALNDAIVILDEPQALPKRWWPLVQRLAVLLTDEYNATIIAMTATQPQLFTNTSDLTTTSLIEDPDSYYELAQRVTYTIDGSVQSYASEEETTLLDHESAATRIVNRIYGQESTSRPRSSALAVCNTIASSRALTSHVETALEARTTQTRHVGTALEAALTELETDPGQDITDTEDAVEAVLRRLGFEHDDEEGPWRPKSNDTGYVMTFNSRYRPRDRQILIDVADTLTQTDVPFVMVSTQAIEAGVDLSFAVAFRDLAPLDSIVQTAGRCNRSFEWGPEAGDVTVWLLADPDDPDSGVPDTPAALVYNQSANHLPLIADVLTSTLPSMTDVPETHLTREAVPAYFEEVRDRGYGSESFVTLLEHVEADSLGKKSLIREDYETVDVLVAITAAEQALTTRIGEAFTRGDEGTAYELLQTASDLRVTIPKRLAEDHLQGVPRIDRREWGDTNGSPVLEYQVTGHRTAYQFDAGGFTAPTSDSVTDRFTI